MARQVLDTNYKKMVVAERDRKGSSVQVSKPGRAALSISTR